MPGISGYETVFAETAINSDGEKTITAQCPPGKTIIGGGAQVRTRIDVANEPIALHTSLPIDAGNYFVGKAVEVSPYADNWFLQVVAICANVAP